MITWPIRFLHKAIWLLLSSPGMVAFGTELLQRWHNPRGEHSSLWRSSWAPAWQVGKGALHCHRCETAEQSV